MAITGINVLTANTRANAAAQLAALANTTAAANATGATAPALGTFSATLAQVLARLGPFALDTLLTTNGTGTDNGAATAPIAGFTSTVFNLLLLQSLGQGNLANQPVAQQLLTAQVLLSTTQANDPLGLGVVATDELINGLTNRGAGANLFAQLSNVSTQPNPLVFSSGALAQAFQIGNGTGSPRDAEGTRMAEYRFVTAWRVAAPVEKVWDALQCLSAWWPGMRPPRHLTPGRDGVGARYERVTRGRLPYDLRYVITVTRFDPPREMAYDSEGDLAGRGAYVLTPAGDATQVVFTWEVATTGFWMNLLAPLLKPLFAWNHNCVMAAGEKGLARYLREQAGGARS